MADDSVAASLGHIPDHEAWHRTIILPRDILDNPPSEVYDDIKWDTESAHRIWGCELIQEAGVLLRYGAIALLHAVLVVVIAAETAFVGCCPTCKAFSGTELHRAINTRA